MHFYVGMNQYQRQIMQQWIILKYDQLQITQFDIISSMPVDGANLPQTFITI